MRVATSFGAAAAIGAFLTTAASGLACDFHAQHVTAATTPAPATETTPVDPVQLANLEKAVVLPAAPGEEAATAGAH